MRRRGDRLARSIAATDRDNCVAAKQPVAQLVVRIDRRDDRFV